MKSVKIFLSILLILSLIITGTIIYSKIRATKIDREYQQAEITRIVRRSKDIMSQYRNCLEYEDLTITDTNIAIEKGLTTTNTRSKINKTYKSAVYGNYVHGTYRIQGDIDVYADSLFMDTDDSQTIDKTSEFYAVAGDDHVIIYSKIQDEQNWTYQKQEDGEFFDESNNLKVIDVEKMLNEDLLKNGTLTTNSEQNIITVKIAPLIEDKDIREELFGDSDFNFNDLENAKKIFGDATVKYVFDKDCRLLEILSNGLFVDMVDALGKDVLNEKFDGEYSVKTYTTKIDISKKFTRFGDITEEETKLPDEIKNIAKEKISE